MSNATIADSVSDLVFTLEAIGREKQSELTNAAAYLRSTEASREAGAGKAERLKTAKEQVHRLEHQVGAIGKTIFWLRAAESGGRHE